MKLSTSIHRLKRIARVMSRAQAIPLHCALDRVAAQHGCESWSLLMSRARQRDPAKHFLDMLQPGELALIGARPGQGKTVMALRIALAALNEGRTSAFLTLEYTTRDVLDRLQGLGAEPHSLSERLLISDSDEMDAAAIMAALADASAGMVVAIDYLQLLDRRRSSPDLDAQLASLKRFAQAKGITFLFLSQIDRRFGARDHVVPDVGDIRHANPFDIGAFDRFCFLHGGKTRFRTAVAGHVKNL